MKKVVLMAEEVSEAIISNQPQYQHYSEDFSHELI
jgi:hypothetical protein